MTPRNLFIIILKVIGLLFLKDMLAAIPQLFSTLAYPFQSNDIFLGVMLLLVSVLSFSLYGLIPYIFIFKSAWLVDKLKLDQGFEQATIPLNAHRSYILSVAIIVIGGMLVANEVPDLARQLLTYSQERRDGHLNPELSYLLLTIAKIAIGMLLITKQQQLVNFIEYQRKR